MSNGGISLRTHRLSIILPTYNEAENIGEAIERIEKSLEEHEFEIIVVDDNSTDGTAQIAEKLNEKYKNIRVLKRPGKLGLASAVLDGIKIASGEVITVMDADLQHPPEILPEMLDKISEGYNLVVASRYVHGGGVKDWSFYRMLISKGAILLAHFLLPRTRVVKDPMSGYFMFKREVIEGVKLNPKGYKILLEVLVKGSYIKVAEIPYEFSPRRRGKSKLNLGEIINYMHLLLKLKFKP